MAHPASDLWEMVEPLVERGLFSAEDEARCVSLVLSDTALGPRESAAFWVHYYARMTWSGMCSDAEYRTVMLGKEACVRLGTGVALARVDVH